MPVSFTRQVVILAAGKSSRFEPFNLEGHKCCYTLAGKSILEHLIANLNQAGFSRVVVVTNPHDHSLSKLLQTPPFSHCTIVHQPNHQGQADALIHALPVLENRFLVINPQQLNLVEHLNQSSLMTSIEENPESLGVFAQETSTPERYGMLKLEGNRILQIVEKPSEWKQPKSLRALGILILTKAFIKFMSEQEPDEYQLERDLSRFALDHPLYALESSAESLSLKYPSDLFPLAQHILGQTKPFIDPTATIHPSAIIEGAVTIAPGAHIYHHSLIQGPAYIGKNVIIGSFCKVRNGSVLEESAEIQNAVEVKHTLLGAGSHIHSGFLGDSIIGQQVRIGAGFITANRRLDRKNIAIKIKGNYIDTHTNSLGAIIGDHVSIGIHSGTNPGRIIPAKTVIPPGTIW